MKPVLNKLEKKVKTSEELNFKKETVKLDFSCK